MTIALRLVRAVRDEKKNTHNGNEREYVVKRDYIGMKRRKKRRNEEEETNKTKMRHIVEEV